MKHMSGVQQGKLTKILTTEVVDSVDDAIERAITGAQVFQITATVSSDTLKAIKKAARTENLNQDETAATLIEEALTNRGLLR